MDRIVKPPVRRPAIMYQHAKAVGQDAMRLDGRHAPLGVHAVPCQRVAGGDVQPVQLAGHAQARFVGVQDRRGMQLLGNALRRRLQGRARFGHPRQQRGRRDREAIDIVDQFSGACVWQHLALGQMHAQRAHIGAVLHQFGHLGGKAAHVGLAAAASHRQRAVFDDVEHGAGHIDDLAPFGDLSLRQWQRAVTAHALLRQWMMDRIGRFGDTFERRALVASLAARWLARRLAQRTRLLGQSIGRRRLARILASLVHLRLQRVQTRKQTQNERVLLLVREDGKVRSRWFLCHASMMNVSGTVYNLFIAAIAAEQSQKLLLNFRRISNAAVDNGTVRDSPFFVSTKNAVRFSMLTCSQRSSKSSPRRMAVSIASKVIGSMNGFLALLSACCRKLNSSPFKRLSRDGAPCARRTTRHGFSTCMPHSFRAISIAWLMIASSRFTVLPFTALSLRSRQDARSMLDKADIRIVQIGSLNIALIFVASMLAPFFAGVTSAKYRDSTSESVDLSAALESRHAPRSMSRSTMRAQRWASALVLNVLVWLGKPRRRITAWYENSPRFKIDAIQFSMSKVSWTIALVGNAAGLQQ